MKVQVLHLSSSTTRSHRESYVQACGTHTFIKVGFLYLTLPDIGDDIDLCTRSIRVLGHTRGDSKLSETLYRTAEVDHLGDTFRAGLDNLLAQAVTLLPSSFSVSQSTPMKISLCHYICCVLIFQYSIASPPGRRGLKPNFDFGNDRNSGIADPQHGDHSARRPVSPSQSSLSHEGPHLLIPPIQPPGPNDSPFTPGTRVRHSTSLVPLASHQHDHSSGSWQPPADQHGDHSARQPVPPSQSLPSLSHQGPSHLLIPPIQPPGPDDSPFTPGTRASHSTRPPPLAPLASHQQGGPPSHYGNPGGHRFYGSGQHERQPSHPRSPNQHGNRRESGHRSHPYQADSSRVQGGHRFTEPEQAAGSAQQRQASPPHPSSPQHGNRQHVIRGQVLHCRVCDAPYGKNTHEYREHMLAAVHITEVNPGRPHDHMSGK